MKGNDRQPAADPDVKLARQTFVDAVYLLTQIVEAETPSRQWMRSTREEGGQRDHTHLLRRLSQLILLPM